MIMGESKGIFMYCILEYGTNKITFKKCHSETLDQTLSYSSEKVFLHHNKTDQDMLTLSTVDDLVLLDP